jgi:hypothetical protein
MVSIVVRFQPEMRDHLRASTAIYREGRLRTCDRVAGTVAFVAMLTLLVVGGWPWWLSVVIGLVGIAEWSDVFHGHTVGAWLSFKRNKTFRDEYMITFIPEGLHFKTVSIDSNVTWSFYDSVVEDSKLFLLRSGKSSSSVIPKRAFAGNDEIDRFRTMVQAAIPNYSKQRF